MRITGGPDAPVVTDGPFAEAAEVAGGYYVFEAENLDDALALARDIPIATYGAVEVWPMAGGGAQPQPLEGSNWLALLLEPPDRPVPPGTPGVGGDGRSAPRVRCGGRPAHQGRRRPASAVDGNHGAGAGGEVLISDGPYVEGAEVANGFYVLSAADRDEAVKIASMIPASTMQVRQLAGVSRL